MPNAKGHMKCPMPKAKGRMNLYLALGIWHLAFGISLLPGCKDDPKDDGGDMARQPYYRPMEPSDFFADGRSARPAIPGVVPWGRDSVTTRPDDSFIRANELLWTGKIGGKDAERFPLAITRPLFDRGRQQFDIYCAPCHGRTGEGDGIVVRRGFQRPPSYYDPRLVAAPVGHFFDVISNGFGAMYSQADRIAVEDRWAIVAYIRALQLSQHATPADVPSGQAIAPQESHP